MARRAEKTSVASIVAAVSLGLAMGLAGCGSSTASGKAATGYPTLPVPTATATLAPTATPIGAVWTRVSDLSQAASVAPAVLRTQYDVFSGQDSKTSAPYFRLRRSDDFGQTWVNLTPPQIAGVSYPANIGYVTGEMSPLNPKVYILTLQLYNAPCPNGNRNCQIQYVTTDGGATWSHVTLPASGLLGAHSPISIPQGMAPLAQGTRLYSFLSSEQLAASGVTPSGRLVVSDDGGVTWRFTDAPLAARNLSVYGFTAPLSGSTVYAIVGAPLDSVPGPTPTLSLWRSGDAGATWTAAGALPSQYVAGLLASVNQVNGQVSLYLLAGTKMDAPSLYASANGGATWSAPTALPENPVSTNMVTLLATLPNGDLLLNDYGVIEVWDGTASAPRIVTQPTGLQGGDTAYLTTLADGSTRLWLAGYDANGNANEYTTIRV